MARTLRTLTRESMENCRFVASASLDNIGPAGAINSCAADMARWVQLQLNRGKFADREGHLFAEQRSKEMWAAQTIVPVWRSSSSARRA